MEKIQKYLMLVSTAIQKMDLRDIPNILEALTEAETIYVIGNGGSAATAQHFALDLYKAAKLNARSLVSDIPTITAYANDDGYDSVFSSQLRYARRSDVLVAISCSGNSLNVLRAVRQAKEFGLITIGFTGDDGGKLAEVVDYLVKVPFEDIKIQEDAHVALCHAVTKALEK